MLVDDDTMPTYRHWQQGVWFSLVGWWLIGFLCMLLFHWAYQWEWAIGCLLGGVQGISINWVANQLKKQVAEEATETKRLVGMLLLLSFVKTMAIAIAIVCFSGGSTLKCLVVMLAFLGYNCFIVIVSAFLFNKMVLTVR
jgi:hypothetical protein